MSVSSKRSAALTKSRPLEGAVGVVRVGFRVSYVGATSNPIRLPARLRPGDLVVLAVWERNNSAVSTATLNGVPLTPTYHRPSGATGCSVWAGWAVSDEVQTVTLGFSSIAGTATVVAVVYRGVDIVPDAVSQAGSASTVTFTVPEIVTASDGSLVLTILGSIDDNTLTQSDPNWTTVVSGNPSTALSFLLVEREVVSAGSSGALDVTQVTNGPDSTFWATVALRKLGG